MKHFLYVFFCLTCITGCNKTASDPDLASVERALETDPSSAYEQLTHYKPRTKDDKARHSLLTVKAKNLAYLPLDGNDTIAVREAIEYYAKRKDWQQLMVGYYLLGSIYRDLGNGPRGVEAFMTVRFVADTTSEDCDFGLMARAEAQKAELQRTQSLHVKAINSIYRAEYYSLKARDTSYANDLALGMLGSQALAGNYEPLLNETDGVVECCVAHGDTLILANWAVGLAWHYLQKERVDEAERMLGLYERYGGRGYPMYYGTKGELALARQQVDSAEIYFRREAEASDWNNRQAAYRGLKMVFEQRHQTDSALKYATLQCEAVDSDYQHKVATTTLQMEHAYNYEAEKERARQAQAEQQRLQLMTWIAGLSAVVVALVAFIRLQTLRSRARRKIMEQELENEKQKAMMAEQENNLAQEKVRRKDAEEQAQLLEADIIEITGELRSMQLEREQMLAERERLKACNESNNKETEERLHELERKLNQREQEILDAEIEINRLEDSLSAQRDLIAGLKGAVSELQEQTYKYRALGDGMQQMRKCLKNNKAADLNDWIALQHQVERNCPTFITTLQEYINPLKERDLQLALLVRVGFHPSEIACLMNIGFSAVTMQRRRLYRKAFGKVPDDIDAVDEWICSIK